MPAGKATVSEFGRPLESLSRRRLRWGRPGSHGGVHGGAEPRPSFLALVSPGAPIVISEASLRPLCPGHQGPRSVHTLSSLAQGALFVFVTFFSAIFCGLFFFLENLVIQMLNFLD